MLSPTSLLGGGLGFLLQANRQCQALKLDNQHASLLQGAAHGPKPISFPYCMLTA